MEAKIHKELSVFLAQHSLEESASNVDEVVLSYLLGIVELIAQGEVEDCFDLEDVTEMMNAYLPGFDRIDRSSVLEWMFGLASQLDASESTKEETENSEENELESSSKEMDKEDAALTDNVDDQSETPIFLNRTTNFPMYDFSCDSTNLLSLEEKNICIDKEDKVASSRIPQLELEKNVFKEKNTAINAASINIISPTPSQEASDKKTRQTGSKRKGRLLSSSSQESQDETPKKDLVPVLKQDHVSCLLEMFPAACSLEVKHCLQLSDGDMDQAAQLIIDRQELGQAIVPKVKSLKNKVKKKTEYKLDDDSVKSCVIERYSFVDTEEDKKTFKPPPLKGEAKKMVRYRDGQIVSMKGERFSEVKKKESEDMKETYMSLKPARKYRFH